MIFFALLILYLGFYAFYRTSKRVVFKPSLIQKWVHEHLKLTKSMGLVLMAVGYYLMCEHYGLGAGSFIATIALMTIASLVILLSPWW